MEMIELVVYPHSQGETVRDENGDFVKVPAAPYTIRVHSVYPTPSDEIRESNRDGVTSARTILAAAGTVVSPHDEIEIDQKRWEVDGEPSSWGAMSNPLVRRGFRVAPVSFPTLGTGCVEIKVVRHEG